MHEDPHQPAGNKKQKPAEGDLVWRNPQIVSYPPDEPRKGRDLSSAIGFMLSEGEVFMALIKFE